MNTKILILAFLMLAASFISEPKVIFAQQKDAFEEDESGEEILAREQFIIMRRAGGPGKVLSPNAYTDALSQKEKMIQDKDIPSSPTRTTSWVSINPAGMFYSRTNANYISGRTNSIAFHPTDPNTFYIASAQGGAWKTTDGGVNWTVLTDILPTLACGDIVVDKNNPNIIYLGTGELNYSGDSQYGNGIYKSTNAGLSWTQVATTTQVGSRVSMLAIDPTNSNIIFASTNLGVYKSTNAGVNWATTSAGTNANCIIIDQTNTQIIYIAVGGTNAGTIKKSTDGGATWLTLTSGLPSGMGRIHISIARSNTLILYASISNSSGALVGLYKTTDAGSTWSAQATTPNYLGSQGWYDNSIIVKPTDPNYVLVGGLDVYASSTGGTSLVQKSQWAATDVNVFCHADIHRLEYNGSVLYCCSDGGVYKSTNDGTNWTDLNRNISTLQYESADYDPTNTLSFQGGTQDNNKQTSTNGGTQWIQRTTGDGGYTIVDPVSPNYVYGQYVNGSIQRSGNAGVSFSSITPSSSSGGLFYNPYEMAPGDHNTIVFARADVWITNSATSATSTSGWTQIATTSVMSASASAIAISATNTNKIYIGTSSGYIWVTTNGGTNWSQVNGYNYISDLIVDNTNDNICYASITGTSSVHVIKTTNSGANWTNVTSNLPNIAANSILLRTASPRMLFVGTDIGVFQSTNDGANWASFNNGLPACQVYDMKYKVNAGLLLVATHGRGCWTFDLNSTLGIDPFGQIPENYKLAQNYPNPFNPETNIEFDIAKYGQTVLQIYDVSGKKVDELVNQNLNAGHYKIQWNASKLSSGIYFTRLTTKDFTSIIKMSLIK